MAFTTVQSPCAMALTYITLTSSGSFGRRVTRVWCGYISHSLVLSSKQVRVVVFVAWPPRLDWFSGKRVEHRSAPLLRLKQQIDQAGYGCRIVVVFAAWVPAPS